MLQIRFDLEMVDEVSTMLKTDLKHLRILAEQWTQKKPKESPKKVGIKKLLKIKFHSEFLYAV